MKGHTVKFEAFVREAHIQLLGWSRENHSLSAYRSENGDINLCIMDEEEAVRETIRNEQFVESEDVYQLAKDTVKKMTRILYEIEHPPRDYEKYPLPTHITCHDCKKVFSVGKEYWEHQEKTGHRNPTISDLILKATNAVFEKAASRPRKQYWKDIGKIEESK